MIRASLWTSLRCAVTLAVATVTSAVGPAEASWELLGPYVGYQCDSFCVTEQAMYVGMAEEDHTGLGLYRYRFAEEEWELVAFPGKRIMGVSVAGPSDEWIVASRYHVDGDSSDVLRSTDGGRTWTSTWRSPYGGIYGRVLRAPSDPAHLYIVDGLRSVEEGESWQVSEFIDDWVNTRFDAAFDPQNEDVLYLTATNAIEADNTYKSTDAGANFVRVDIASFCYGIAVDAAQPARVLAVYGTHTRTSTDAGGSWITRACPLSGKMVAVASWAQGAFFVLGSAAGHYAVARTWDLGATWEFCGSGLPEVPAGGLWGLRMFIDSHATDPDLYVALEGSGVWRLSMAAGAPSDTDRGLHALRLTASPNPAGDEFRVHLRLPEAAPASLRLLDVGGRVVDTLFEGVMPEGVGEVRWVRPARGAVPAGAYYLRLDAGSAHAERRIVLLK